MSDNTVINPGTTGDNIATDDIGGVKFQRIKLIHGNDGTNDGDVSTTNQLPIKLTNLEKAEDAGHTTGDSGVMLLAVRSSTATPLAGTNLDYIPLITDANGRLWVTALIDTALPAGTNAIGKLSANSGVDIGDVDVTSIVPGTGATNLGKAEDAAHVSADTGVMALAVRSNTAASTSGADGDYQPLITNTTGHLWVDASGQTLTVGSHNVTNAGTFAVQATLAAGAANIAKAEDAASADADVGVPALAVRKATPANTSGLDGDYEFLQISAGRLWASATIDAAIPAGTNAIGKLAANDGIDVGDVTINNASGASAVNIQDGGNSVTVDGTVAISSITTSVTPGTAATDLGKAEDAVHASADVGVMGLAVRTDAPANRSGADGDYEPLQISAGRLWVNIPTAGTATLSNVAGSATSVPLLASNASRRGATFFNDSTALLYLKFGATASTTSFTTQLSANGYYELPLPIYTGAIDGIWASATGNVRVTELS
mgnify:CR=1 FL=1